MSIALKTGADRCVSMATKTANPTITEHFVDTGETIVREMTQEELTNFNAFFDEVNSVKNAVAIDEATKAATKAAVLAKLGLTAEELLAVIG